MTVLSFMRGRGGGGGGGGGGGWGVGDVMSFLGLSCLPRMLHLSGKLF